MAGRPASTNRIDYPDFQRHLQKQGLSLPTADEWAYLCGGGCRTLFPLGDGLDYSMRLHWFEDMDEEYGDRPTTWRNPISSGLSIAFAPICGRWCRRISSPPAAETAGAISAAAWDPSSGSCPASPHYKPEVQEDSEINGDYDFYRPIIRVEME